MQAVAVSVFVIEPMRYWVSAVASTPRDTSAVPNAVSQSGSRSRTMETAIDGRRLSACSRRTSRSSSAIRVSGADKSSERARDQLDRAVDVLVRDVEVGNGAEHPRTHGARKPDTGRVEALPRLGARQPERRDVDVDEIRLDLLEIDRQPGRGETLGEPSRARVIVGDPVDVVVECMEAGRGDDPGLAHGAAEQVLRPARLDHQILGTGDEGAERTAEALREAERDGVEAAADLGRRDTLRDCCVDEPRTVEVQPQVEL